MTIATLAIDAIETASDMLATSVTSGIGSVSSPSRRDMPTSRSTVGQAFLFQAYPLFNRPDLDPEVRRHRIQALAARLFREGSRYWIAPWNWWKIHSIFQARELYTSLIYTSLMYDIDLPDITW
jgi:hypothetical protein